MSNAKSEVDNGIGPVDSKNISGGLTVHLSVIK